MMIKFTVADTIMKCSDIDNSALNLYVCVFQLRVYYQLGSY